MNEIILAIISVIGSGGLAVLVVTMKTKILEYFKLIVVRVLMANYFFHVASINVHQHF